MKFLRNTLLGLLLGLGLPLFLVWGQAIAESVNGAALTRQPIWTVELSASSLPFVANEQVLVPTANSITPDSPLHALSAATGDLQWQSEEPGQKVLNVADSKIYTSNENNRLMVINLATGKTQSAFQFAEPGADLSGSAIGAAGDTFILSISEWDSDRNEVSARTANQTLWTYLTPPDSLVACDFYESYDSLVPVVHEGVVVLPILVNPQTEERGYHITALDASTGQELWTWTTTEDFLDDFTVLGNTVYPAFSHSSASDDLSWVKALDLRTGEERWSYPMFGKVKMASDREVFIWDSENSNSTRFAVVDLQTGEFRRNLELTREDTREPREIAIQDNVIYISDLAISNATFGFYGSADNDSSMNAFDANSGQLLWKTPTLHNQHLYPPVVTGDRLFVASRALDPYQSGVVQAFEIPQP